MPKIVAVIIIEDGEGNELDRTAILGNESKTKVERTVFPWIREALWDLCCFREGR